MEVFDKILMSPGLYWIGEEIFVHLLSSERDFVNCEQVCKKWRNFYIQACLWKKWLMYKTAKVGTFKRSLLNIHPEWTNTSNLSSNEEIHALFKTLVKKFSKDSIRFLWKNSRFSLRKITDWPIVRDLTEVDGDHLIFAQETKIQVAHRNPYSLRNSNEYGLKILHCLIGHRREVTCLAYDAKTNIAVAGGRDRCLTAWNVLKGVLIASNRDSHERLITSIKIYENSAFSSSR